MLKLKVGGVYLTRGGVIVLIERYDEHHVYEYSGWCQGQYLSWDEYGNWYRPGNNNLRDIVKDLNGIAAET